MRALYKREAGPGLELVDLPEAEMGEQDVRIRVLRTGICGTDVHILRWDAWAAANVAAPLVPGHEFYGEVVDVGARVSDITVGDRVSGEGHVVCGMCRNCRAGRRQMCIRTRGIGVQRDGAFAEYVVIPGENVWVHPAELDPNLGAIFDPFGNAVHTALAFPLVGEDVLITGAGPIGLMATAIARHVGARRIAVTDLSPARLALARRMGADIAIDAATESIADAQRHLGMREGFDVGLEMSGQASALREMTANMNHGGHIALLGLPAGGIELDVSKIITHMLTIRGIYGREMFETWYQMSAMLDSGLDISPVVTDVVPIQQWGRAFELADDASHGKIVLDWTS